MPILTVVREGSLGVVMVEDVMKRGKVMRVWFRFSFEGGYSQVRSEMSLQRQIKVNVNSSPPMRKFREG